MSDPWLIATQDIPPQVGEHLDFTREVVLTSPLGTEVLAVPAGDTLFLTGSLDIVDQGVVVRVDTVATAHGNCVRCLDPITRQVSVDTSDMYYLPAARQALVAEGDSEAADARELCAQGIDLRGLVIDALVPQLPYAPLCDPDCAGLCPQCGIRLDEAGPGHSHQQADPRWEALRGFFDKEQG